MRDSSILVGLPSWLSTSSPVATPAKRHGRREEERLAGHEVFGLPHVGTIFSAGCQVRADTSEGDRRARLSAEGPPRHRIRDRLDLRRELVVQTLAERRRIASSSSVRQTGPGDFIGDMLNSS